MDFVLQVTVVPLDDSVVFYGDLELRNFAFPVIDLSQTLFKEAVQAFDFGTQSGDFVFIVSKLGLKVAIFISFSLLSG